MTIEAPRGDARTPWPAPRRILVTGATGCVGHYLVERLLTETPHHLVLLARDRSRLPSRAVAAPGRVTVLDVDLAHAETLDHHRDAIGAAQAAVLLAACWGGPDTDAVNVHATLTLVSLLDRARCRRIVVASTASIVDTDGHPLEAARAFGTPYIRSKLACRDALTALTDAPPLTTLYPTLVVGGSASTPLSHLTVLMRELVRYRRVLSLLRARARFHLIHADDIARVIGHVLDDESDESTHLVLGNEAVTLDEAVSALCAHAGVHAQRWIPLSTRMARLVLPLTPIRLSVWDRYCLEHPELVYRNVVSPASFGMSSTFASLPDLVRAGLEGS